METTLAGAVVRYLTPKRTVAQKEKVNVKIAPGTVFLRRTMFATGALLRWFVWAIVAVIGLFAQNSYIFLVFPGSKRDLDGYCFSWIFPFIKEKPNFAGFIKTAECRGITVAMPETVKDFRDNAEMVERIMKRLNFVRRFIGAKAIGIASVGPKYFRKNNPDGYVKPFIYGLRGRVFSVVETVEKVISENGYDKANFKVAIVGVGEIGEAIIENLTKLGYKAEGIEIIPETNGISIDEIGLRILKEADGLIVQTPRGSDFEPFYAYLKPGATVIDDTHPRILNVPPHNKYKFYKVAIANSINGIQGRFRPALTGYKQTWFPGCCIEMHVAVASGNFGMDQCCFNREAKKHGFYALTVS